MTYQNFDNTKNKIENNWNKTEDNKNQLENIPIVSLNFNSINFNKKITEVVILNNELLTTSNKSGSILLKNFSDWAMSSIEPIVIAKIGDGYVSKLKSTFPGIEFRSGRLKTGDVFWTDVADFKYWFVRQDNNFLIKYNQISCSAREVSVIHQGYFMYTIPTYVTFKLKFYNYSFYHTTNEKFE